MSIFKGISDDLALRATTEKGAQGSLCFDELQVSVSKFQVADLGLVESMLCANYWHM